MSSLSEKWRQLKYKLKHNLSIENVVLVAAVALCLSLTYQSIVSMTRNWELAEKLNAEKKSLELLNVEIEMAELENDYYASEEYQELSARRLANKQLPGEKMVYLPENSEVAKNKHASENANEPMKAEEKTYSNFEQWMGYLFP